MLYSSSLALIMMLEVEPKERLMRGGAVMMRECGSAKRLPFLPDAKIMAALPNACSAPRSIKSWCSLFHSLSLQD